MKLDIRAIKTRKGDNGRFLSGFTSLTGDLLAMVQEALKITPLPEGAELGDNANVSIDPDVAGDHFPTRGSAIAEGCQVELGRGAFLGDDGKVTVSFRLIKVGTVRRGQGDLDGFVFLSRREAEGETEAPAETPVEAAAKPEEVKAPF